MPKQKNMTNRRKTKVFFRPAVIGGVIIFVLIMIGVLILSTYDDNRNNKDSASSKDSSGMSQSDDSLRSEMDIDSLKEVRISEIDDELASLKPFFEIKHDDFEGITWIVHNGVPLYTNSRGFYLYIGQNDDSSVFLRFVVRYYGDDWLFIQKISIRADDQQFQIELPDMKRDHNSKVWEWFDVSPTGGNIFMIERIIEAKETKVRFTGKQSNRDIVLTEPEVNALKETLQYYNLLRDRNSLEKK